MHEGRAWACKITPWLPGSAESVDACQGVQARLTRVERTLPWPSCVTRRDSSYRSSLSDFTTATRRPAACTQRTPACELGCASALLQCALG